MRPLYKRPAQHLAGLLLPIAGLRRSPELQSSTCISQWGPRKDQEGVSMYLWEKFNGEVEGWLFWPIMFVMLGVLIPIVMAIR